MATTNIFNMTDSWNNAGVVFTAVKMNVTDTASDPTSLLMDLQIGGASQFKVGKSGAITTSFMTLNLSGAFISGSLFLGPLNDAILLRDAADTLAQRRGTNPQTLRVYNTFTDASNYERGIIGWNAGVLEVGTEQAGTGNPRVLRLKSSGGGSIGFSTNGADRWTISTAGYILANTDNTYDIGASGANRPRNIYVGSALNVTGNTGLGVVAQSDAYIRIGASAAGISSIRLGAGVTPTAPTNGDIWFDGTNIKMQIGGVAKTFTLT